ncbi:hypothetical protein COX84_01390 [Candidatus Micrarchaeota archaeon CG_4_10_14_0_2_um_filter_49_7]|nr:MAG: hypothetical protein AUJ13_05360 [Candidatus Micrarchaeota archaeon CG1_02_49_24]PIZ99078.1 MAG: hypothetical protein COX84_01390 [Candidatus Micrarchaeota archaeon CG_4_10_14_0_2_um_filter_49_7]HII53716.1 phosphatase PAP2 family protein [Candidatus Micrarchaeota archaeon]
MDPIFVFFQAFDSGLLTTIAIFIDKYMAFIMLAMFLATYAATSDKKSLTLFIVNMVVSVLVLSIAKGLIDLPRPCTSMHSKIACPADASYPSGHTLISTGGALATAGNPLFPAYLAFAALTGISRVYLGIHTLYDVAGGIALAFVSYAISKQALSFYTKEMRIEP